MAMKYSVIVAACANSGIGNKGNLPWPRIPTDQKYFECVTAKTFDSSLKNVVIMGRKTYESIPPKFRPLKNRINIVVSQTMKDPSNENLKLATSFDDALQLAGSYKQTGLVESIFVIGGQQNYELAVRRCNCERIYYTRIAESFEVDTFFPDPDQLPGFRPVDTNKLKEILANYLPASVVESNGEVHENGVHYRFQVYDRSSENGSNGHH